MNQAPTRLLAVVLVATAAALSAGTAMPLNGRIDVRPLTPSDITDYALTGAEKASGLSTVPIGQPVYLDAQVNIQIPVSDIQSVTWALTSVPLGSVTNGLLTDSPLGANVPVYKPADRLLYQVAGRTVLRPDVRGQYVVTATITTGASGTTNVTQTLTAGMYMGVNTCELCHSGGLIAPNKYELWTNTLHATKFSRSIDGLVGFYSSSCISCHTVGYDNNALAVNGGFDDVAKQLGWTFPTVLTNGNWAGMPAALQNVANIQCENCHGPGSEHAYALGDTSRISVSFSAGDCGQCHDAKTHHVKNPEWANSKHAITTRIPSGANRINCVRCHTPAGFKGYIENMGNTNGYATNTVYEAMSCAGCHDPHDATNPHQLRAGTNTITLSSGTTVTGAGFGTFCMNCHQSRTGSVTNSIVNYPLGLPTWANGSSFGPHDSPVADMLEGVNGWEYGQSIPSSAHRFAVENTCVGCHMQSVNASDPAFLKAGGHTMNMSYDAVTAGVTNTVDMVGICSQCHGPINSFDMPRDDYNGDGIIEGVQTEVQHLLDKLSTLLPGSAWRADGNYAGAGVVQTSASVKTNWQSRYLKAAWNFQLVANDKSRGVHNAPYAVGLLKASIADLTGDANNDGLPDSWQVQYFGSPTNASAAPNASPAGDGIPNWLKWSLGLDPTQPGINIPGGVVWANGKNLVNPPIDPNATNSVAIYTAAEVVFNTEAGKTYQIQAISSLGDGWQNVGDAIPGTGNPISYVTPTRSNAQQFYRVVHTP
jgi:predicted CXXCH cytochrome family protein